MAAAAVVAIAIAPAHDGGGPPPTSTISAAGGLGLAGPYTPADYPAMRRAGVRNTLVELSWAAAEPAPGRFSSAYFDEIRHQIESLRGAGFLVDLNTGIYEAPSWLLDMPGARFVDQNGDVYTSEPVPNLVFDTQLRGYAQTYLDKVFGTLGNDFSYVRAGGGHFGELSYPSLRTSSGAFENLYWAFDRNAQRTSPVPGWRPGDPTPENQAGRFLNYYFTALERYQNWQTDALRNAGYDGWIAMLYPSFGMRPGDEQAAIDDDLDGASHAETNGEVQRGYDSALQIHGLTDQEVIVYGTWGEQPATLSWLASLAATKHLPVMAENSGGNTVSQLQSALANARRLHLIGFTLVRASDFFTPTGSSSLFPLLDHEDFAATAGDQN